MKNLTYLFVVIIITVCNITPPTPVAPIPIPTAPAASAPQQDWTFSVTINGTTHKAEGTYIYPHYDVATGYYFELEDLDDSDNIAFAENTQVLELSMLDKSESTYISGDHINIAMGINNLSLGVNNIYINWGQYSGRSQTIVDELPFVYTGGLVTPAHSYGFQNTQGTLSLPQSDPQPNLSLSSFPINITDLGTKKELIIVISGTIQYMVIQLKEIIQALYILVIQCIRIIQILHII